jgi:hypothetical protein
MAAAFMLTVASQLGVLAEVVRRKRKVVRRMNIFVNVQ